MNKKIAVIFLALSVLACGMQAALPTVDVSMASHDYTLPPLAAESAEPTDTAPVYVTIAPLNVRACASVDCEKLADLPISETVTMLVTDLIQGAGCDGGGWYAITAPKSGYVCSLYIEER